MNAATAKSLGEIFARRFAIDCMDESSSTEPLDLSRANFHAAIDAMQADIDRLRKDAITALADGGVLIRLPRVEGYEDVCDELLAADALEGINWPSYELLTAEETKGR